MKTNIGEATQFMMASLQAGVDISNREIFLFGPIQEMTAYRFISGFRFLDRSDGPINVIISSPGGNADEGLAIYDTLRVANNPVVTTGFGGIASAAVPIFLAGSARFIGPEARVMVHDLSYDIEGSIGTPVILSLGKETERTNKRYYEIIAGRTGKSIKDIEKWCKEETVFDAPECIKIGLADKILQTRDLPKDYKSAVSEITESFHQQHRVPSKKKRTNKKGKK